MEVNDYWDDLSIEGENWDDIPYEELCRRADGLPPITDYVCIDTRSVLERYPILMVILVIGVLTPLLGLLQYYLF